MRSTVGARATALAVALIAIAVLAGSGVPLRAQNARWGANYFPDVTLTTHEGKRVRFYDDLLKGKIVAINLIYTTCKYSCPLETARLAQVQKIVGDRMGRDVFFYSISIDPENDTPEVLDAYAKKFHAGPGWLFLTGQKQDIDTISKKLGLYSPPGASADGHTPHLLVGNEATGQWIRNSGLDNPNFLATTISSWLNSWQTAAKPTKTYAEAPKIDLNAGSYAFKTHCAACHTIGGGDQIGPDLAGVTTRRDRRWLTRFITSPDRMIAEKDPTSVALLKQYKGVLMPALGLAESDATLLIDYIASHKTPVKAAPPAASVPQTSAPNAAMTPLLEPYLRIQNALSEDATAPIVESARTLAAEAAKLGASGEALRFAAASLSKKAASVAEARPAFDQVGVALMRYASQQGGALGGDVRVAYCPMADKHWLQKGDTIRNPFYGRAMLECGRFVDKIPAAYR